MEVIIVIIDLLCVDAHLAGDSVRFGLYLPGLEKEGDIHLNAKVSYVSDFAWKNITDCPLKYKDKRDGYPFYKGELDLSGRKEGAYRYQYEIGRGDTAYPRWISGSFATLIAA